jgi:hypothetical protein
VSGKAASWALRLALLAGAAALPCALDVSARQAPGADDWKYDVLYLRGKPPLKGLLAEESKDYVLFKYIVRNPGKPTVVFSEKLPRRDIERIDRLSPADREELRKRLEALARERDVLAAQLKTQDPAKRPEMSDVVPLEKVAWPPDPNKSALAYSPRSAYFRLVSSGSPELTRLAVIHLEQVYDAYVRFLPPRIDPARAKPTLILLAGNREDYAVLRRGEKFDFFNPAFYDVRRNQIGCGSDLERLADECERLRKKHAEIKADLEQRKADLNKAYKGRVPPEILADIARAEKEVRDAEQRNDQLFKLARGRFFGRLYHEAFHAYLATWVYPEDEAAVPIWLNEGLAQIFEMAVVEAGELRVRYVSGERWLALRRALNKDTLPPLSKLLTAGSDVFLVNHAREQQESDDYYLASWALAYHLTFERRLLGTKAMDDYVKALKRGTDPLAAFRDLVGMPLPQFEKEYLRYLQELKSDDPSDGK